MRLVITCHVGAGPATASEAERWQALLDALRPALAAAARTRFAPRSLDEVARLVDLLGEPVAACAPDGRIVRESEALRHLLAGDPQGAVLRREIARAAVERVERDERTAPHTVVTDRGSYRLVARHTSFERAVGLTLVTLRHDQPLDGRHAVERFRRRFGLSAREAEVALLLGAGQSNAEVARALGISEPTARHHTQRVLEKLGVHSRAAVPSALIAADLAARDAPR